MIGKVSAADSHFIRYVPQSHGTDASLVEEINGGSDYFFPGGYGCAHGKIKTKLEHVFQFAKLIFTYSKVLARHFCLCFVRVSE
jgi:hypothetical protein